MRYKITDAETQKVYYRKKLPRKIPHNIKTGVIFEVQESYKMIGVIQEGIKTVFSAMRTGEGG